MDTEQVIIGKLTRGETMPHGHKLVQNELGKWFYVIPKKKPFRFFGEIYLNTPGVEGESINHEALMKSIEKNATLMFVYPRVIYTIDSREFADFIMKVNTRRVNLTNGETTYSAPLKIMTAHKRSVL